MEQEKRPIRYEHYCIVVVSTVILASMLLCWSMLLPFSAFLFVVAISEILLMPRYLKVSYSCRRPSSLVQDWLLLFCALGSFIFERPEFPNHLFYVGIMAFAFAVPMKSARIFAVGSSVVGAYAAMLVVFRFSSSPLKSNSGTSVVSGSNVKPGRVVSRSNPNVLLGK